ncbi:MAG TPA: hypothetical protein VK498_02035 [Ferruginibacter sp.]|nr:hypothetical protein [Ferruginibacter sp.]
MRRPGSKYRFMFPIFFIAAALLFGLAVMALWNAILPGVTGIKPISYIQALGILVLSKILFGGFGGGWRRGRGHYQWSKMEARWQDMTPEEREKFKAEWKDRCRRRGRNTEPKEEDNIDMPANNNTNANTGI